MRKLDLTAYEITVNTPEGLKTMPYDMIQSLGVVLFNPQRQLGALELLSAYDLMKNIRAQAENSKQADPNYVYALLEEAEFAQLEDAVKQAKGYNEHDVEFVRRVLNAPKIDIAPKE